MDESSSRIGGDSPPKPRSRFLIPSNFAAVAASDLAAFDLNPFRDFDSNERRAKKKGELDANGRIAEWHSWP